MNVNWIFTCQAVERENAARDLLANMLGFTRHERLDVKKPGPPPAPPVSEAQALLQQLTGSSSENLQKSKKIVHSDDEHGPHSVDTEFAHVVLKTS